MLGRLLNAARVRPPTDYDLLPTSEWSARHSPKLSTGGLVRPWRRCSVTVLVVLVVGVASTLTCVIYLATHPLAWQGGILARLTGPKPLPPLYPEFREAESALPQHRNPDPFANGQKYLWIASHTQWSGWGNFMQDMLMNAHLTYLSGRTYVFDDYTWSKEGPEFSKFGDKWIPSRIPLSALISGPIVGGPFPDGDSTPRAISKPRFHEICPHPTYVRADEVKKLHGGGATAVRIEEVWLEYLSKIDDPCVEVDAYSGNPFHIFMFGTKDEMLPVYPSLSKSPIISLLGWSTLAHGAFEANRDLFSPAPFFPPYVTQRSCPHCFDPYAQLDGLLALHLRRGDFLEHCPNLCHWGANWNAFNRFPELPDQWKSPQGSEEYRMSVYLKSCLPNIEQIVEKIEGIRNTAAGQGLKNIYIMTNGDREWLQDLKWALRRAYPWVRIATSRDTVLTWEQKYVSQTMDMLIGQRAQVFVGNGFSSMTSNIAMLRMARGLPAESTRMW